MLVAFTGPVEAGDALSVNGVTVSSAEVALARYWAKLEAPYQASDDATAMVLAMDKVVADILLADEASAAGETLGKKEVRDSVLADHKADRTAQAVAAAVAELRSKVTITVLDPSLGWAPG